MDGADAPKPTVQDIVSSMEASANQEPPRPRIFDVPDGATDEVMEAVVARMLATRITEDSEFEEPETLLSMASNDAPVLRANGLAFICGQAGSRKTTGLTLMCADMIDPGKIPNSPFKVSRPLKVLYLDTEQAPVDTNRIMKRAKSLVDDTSRLILHSLTEFAVAYIPTLLERAVEVYKPDVVVIDNAAQIGMGNVMDIDRAEILIRNLRRIAVAYNAAVLGVIHVNENESRATKNGKQTPRGHVGRESVRQADIVLQFLDNESALYSEAEALKHRYLKPDKWGVAIDADGIPCYVDLTQSTLADMEHASAGAATGNPDTYAKVLSQIPPTGMAPSELHACVNAIKPMAKRNQERWVAEMVKAQLIIKVKGRYYKTIESHENADENELF